MGNVYKEKVDFKNAIIFYTKYLTLDSQSEECYFNLAYIYHQKKEYELAVEHYKKALKIYIS